MNAQEWFDKGSYKKINGHKVFVIDIHDNNKDKPNLCVLHGFPTSSYDYWKVLADLSEHYRVIIHDHIGFGYSDKPTNYSYSFVDQADIALSLWQQLGIKNASLLAHDYGTSVLTEIIARDNQNYCPITINKIALCNGSVHIELAKLRLMQRLLRNRVIGDFVASLSSRSTIKRNLKNIYVDPEQINDDEIDAIWHMMNFNQGKKVLAKISRYTYERKNLWYRWIGALQETKLPIEIIWPDKDPVAVAQMATVIDAETKNSKLHWLSNAGHFPMLEIPKQWTSQVLQSMTEQ